MSIIIGDSGVVEKVCMSFPRKRESRNQPTAHWPGFPLSRLARRRRGNEEAKRQERRFFNSPTVHNRVYSPRISRITKPCDTATYCVVAVPAYPLMLCLTGERTKACGRAATSPRPSVPDGPRRYYVLRSSATAFPLMLCWVGQCTKACVRAATSPRPSVPDGPRRYYVLRSSATAFPLMLCWVGQCTKACVRASISPRASVPGAM